MIEAIYAYQVLLDKYNAAQDTIRQQQQEIDELKKTDAARLATLTHMGALVEQMEQQQEEIERLRELVQEAYVEACRSIRRERVMGDDPLKRLDAGAWPQAANMQEAAAEPRQQEVKIERLRGLVTRASEFLERDMPTVADMIRVEMDAALEGKE